MLTSYAAGDVFKVRVGYTWFNSPSPDYTVKIYSKQTLEVKDAQGLKNQINMDGSTPSGFTYSTYKGMSDLSWKPAVPKDQNDIVDSMTEVFDAIRAEGGSFWFKLFWQCLTKYSDVCFNPTMW